MAIAIGLLQSVQRSGKKVSAGNIAHYTILALRSGRRSTGIRKNDVLAPACQLNGHARVRTLAAIQERLTCRAERRAA